MGVIADGIGNPYVRRTLSRMISRGEINAAYVMTVRTIVLRTSAIRPIAI